MKVSTSIILILASLLMSCSNDIDERIDLDDYIETGTKYFDKLEFDSAIYVYKQILNIDSTNSDAYKRIANIKSIKGEYDSAFFFISKALTYDTIDQYSYFLRSELHKKLGQFDDAIKDLDYLLSQDSVFILLMFSQGKAEVYEHNELELEKAKILALDGQYEAAISKLNSIRENCNDSIPLLLALAEIYAIQNKVDSDSINLRNEALKIVNSLLQLDNLDCEDNYRCGIILRKLNQNELALECYDKAIKLYPKISHYYFNRANTLWDMKKYRKALLDYNKVIELDSNYTRAYLFKGYIYLELEEYDSAYYEMLKAKEQGNNEALNMIEKFEVDTIY